MKANRLPVVSHIRAGALNGQIDIQQYDRTPTLSPDERSALALVTKHGAYCKRILQHSDAPELRRLLAPLLDLCRMLNAEQPATFQQINPFLMEMQRRQVSFWGWTEAEWIASIGLTREACQRRHGRVYPPRLELLAAAYLFGGFSNFSAFPKHSISPVQLAHAIFGEPLITRIVEQIQPLFLTWGYAFNITYQRSLRQALSLALLMRRSPQLDDLSAELLQTLYFQSPVEHLQQAFKLLMRALAELGILEAQQAVLSRAAKSPSQEDTEGIAPEWVDWCLRWRSTAVQHAELERHKTWLILLKVGRWLAATHPDITSPTQWTTTLAIEWLTVVTSLRVGDFCSTNERVHFCGQKGKPHRPHTQQGHIVAVRTFFFDLQDDPFNIPRTFDPSRALRTPKALVRLLEPDPRDIDPLPWARIVHAAHTLSEADFPDKCFYPLPLVKAMALLWCYGALRVNEIRRLRVGCIRWQREDIIIAETGERLPKEATCSLTIPFDKGSPAFSKAISPVVGKAINEWEALRPQQPRLLDTKTHELVDFLFAYRGKQISPSYINEVLIPLLCDRAGMPSADERGTFTSHRARATIATLLLNAPEGMTIWEMMQWLGHHNVNSTQRYVRQKQQRIAVAYTKAERNSLLIEALVETQADPQGNIRVYYVLGDDGLCSNPEWATCIYRLACRKCPFFIAKEQAQQIRSQQRIKRFLEVVELTEEEKRAAQEDMQKIAENREQTGQFPSPDGLHQRAKGEKGRYIPLHVLDTSDPSKP
jgi:integrase